jgi:hypothetical protein
MRDWRRLLLIALIAFAAAIAGVIVGRLLVVRQPPVETEIHALLHEQLALDAGQKAQLEAIETRFAIRKRGLELQMQADNARLAEAIEAEHGYGPAVRAAVDHSHQVMGELQKETLGHVFAMRSVLRPDQTAQYDHAIVGALTAKTR